MANTTNFGWETPDDTDLVKDGAAAIRTLGSAIDTSLVDLKGGTTGQVLAKASNTDMDFTWATDASGIPATIFDAKGDIIAASAADTAARLAVGANNTVLTADSSTATGLKWASPAVNANWSLVNAGGTALSGSATVTISGISNADKIMILIQTASSASAGSTFTLRFNSDSGANYNAFGSKYEGQSTWSAGNIGAETNAADTRIRFANMANAAGSNASAYILVSGCNSSGVKVFNLSGGASFFSNSGNVNYVSGGWYSGTSTISSVSVLSETGNFDAGTIYVYTSA